tara:strand:+ start:1491 stop:3431 length:1941 start_codon:yes stop_codon:yes gene_type:complete
MTYYKYAERQVDTQINWAEIGKNMSDMLLEERKLRERKRQEIDAATREFGETLSNAPTGDYDAGNTFTLDYANAAQENRRLQDHLLKTGQMSLRDYTVGRQNIQSGTDRLFDLQKTYQAEYKTKMERFDNDESSFREVWEMEQAEGLANLRESRAYINPTNGVVSVGKMIEGENGVKILDPNQNNYVGVNELNQRLKMKYNKFNVDAAADNAANQLGALELSTMKYAGKGNVNQILTMIDAKKHDFGLEGETWAAGYKEWETLQVQSMMYNPNNVASVLTDRQVFIDVWNPNTSQYEKQRMTYTFDKKEYDDPKKNFGQMIYLDRSKDANGIPEFSEKQKELTEQALRIAIRANIDVKNQVKTGGTNQYEPKDLRDAKGDMNKQKDVLTKAAQLWWGNQEQKKKAAESLRAYNDNIKEISLTDSGDGIYITYNNDKAPETIDFGTSQIDFLEGIGNFVLPTNNKIADINKVAKDSGLDLTKQLLQGTDYDFTSMGEQTTTLPFAEAFRRNEGAKINKADVLKDVGPKIDGDKELLIVDKVRAFVKGVPGITADDVTVRDYRAGGQGVVVTIDGEDFNIDVDETAEKAQEGLDAVIDALLGLGIKNSELMDEYVKQYVKDYGTVKPANNQQDNNNKGSASVPRPNGG